MGESSSKQPGILEAHSPPLSALLLNPALWMPLTHWLFWFPQCGLIYLRLILLSIATWILCFFVFLCFSECYHHELSYGNNSCSINVNCFSHPKHHSMDAFFFVFFVLIGLSYLFPPFFSPPLWQFWEGGRQKLWSLHHV